MSEADIDKLKETVLFRNLCDKENLIHEHEISSNILMVVREVTPLLERIPENMPEFTLHNASHSLNVVEIMGKIVPIDTLEHLNIVELSILIYAAYLHDIGMTASREEREEIIASDPGFTKLLIANEELSLKLDKAKKKGDHREATFIEDKLFTQFLREKHVERSSNYILEKCGSGKTCISWKGAPYYKLVQLVCDSHGLFVRDLYDTKRWKRNYLLKDMDVNIQYLSVILRLADILDLDSERTPKCLLDFISPNDETSIKEWKKHLSIVGCKIFSKEIRIEAECEHPIYERTLREFIDMIEAEREESVFLTSHYNDELAKKYHLNLTKPITKDNIQSNGDYIYSDFRFKLDFHRVIDLLMGERLYGNPSIALRELLQNSIDAVRYRQTIEENEENTFSPSIKITLKANELVIEDNGIGMNEHIFEKYFLQIGRSYYNSSECRTSGVKIDPVSEFGIGILSFFMVASKIRVESLRKTLDPLHPYDPINIEIPTAYDYFVRRPSTRTQIGTKITLSLKPNHPFSPSSIIKKISEIAPFIEYKIVVETSEGVKEYNPLLPGEVHGDNGVNLPLKKYFEVTFNELDKSEGIEGTLRVIKFEGRDKLTGYSRRINDQLIAQRGFSIPPDKLLPHWLFDQILMSINLSGQSKLSLSPNRSSIIEDEKYYKLIEKIQFNLLDGLDKSLKTYRDSNTFEKYNKYVDELADANIFNVRRYRQGGFNFKIDSLAESIKKIILTNVPFLTISRDGKQSCKINKDLDKLPIIAITYNSGWPEQIQIEDIFKEIEYLIKPNLIILLGRDSINSEKYGLLDEVLGPTSGIYITSIPGVVIETFESNSDSKIFVYHINHFTCGIHSNTGSNEPLFVHNPDILSDPDRVIFNANHRLLCNFFDGIKPRDANSSKALEYLYDTFGDVISNLNLLMTSHYYREKNEHCDDRNCLYVGILKHYPEILEKFYDAAKEFWENAQDVGAISHNEGFPGFTIEDLPWFWNYEIKQI